MLSQLFSFFFKCNLCEHVGGRPQRLTVTCMVKLMGICPHHSMPNGHHSFIDQSRCIHLQTLSCARQLNPSVMAFEELCLWSAGGQNSMPIACSRLCLSGCHTTHDNFPSVVISCAVDCIGSVLPFICRGISHLSEHVLRMSGIGGLQLGPIRRHGRANGKSVPAVKNTLPLQQVSLSEMCQ